MPRPVLLSLSSGLLIQTPAGIREADTHWWTQPTHTDTRSQRAAGWVTDSWGQCKDQETLARREEEAPALGLLGGRDGGEEEEGLDAHNQSAFVIFTEIITSSLTEVKPPLLIIYDTLFVPGLKNSRIDTKNSHQRVCLRALQQRWSGARWDLYSATC